MQWRIEVTLRDGTVRYVRDRRGSRPNYASFSVESADECTVAPCISVAKEVRDAFNFYCENFGPSGLGYQPISVKLRPVREEITSDPAESTVNMWDSYKCRVSE